MFLPNSMIIETSHDVSAISSHGRANQAPLAATLKYSSITEKKKKRHLMVKRVTAGLLMS